jgi:hypothetical protein
VKHADINLEPYILSLNGWTELDPFWLRPNDCLHPTGKATSRNHKVSTESHFAEKLF